MAYNAETSPQWKTTIILSTSLQNHDTVKTLSGQQHRIRFSDTVECGAFIFPLSGTAFLLADPDPCEESGLTEKLMKFVQVHRNSFLLLHAPFSGKKELETMSLIQHRIWDTVSMCGMWVTPPGSMIGVGVIRPEKFSRFFGTNLRILPVRNSGDIIKGMLTIAKATSKPHVDRIRDRMSLAQAHIIESSPVWEMLRDIL